MVKVEPEEMQAIAAAMQPVAGAARSRGEVVTRDFQKPQRLSPTQLAELRKRILEGVSSTRDALKSMLRSDIAVKLIEVDEVSCESLFGDLRAPMAVLQFSVRRQLGWVVWDPTAALAALELALGQPSGGQGDVRMFTPIEALMLQRLLASTAASVLHCVQLAPEAPEMVRDPALLGSWRDGGAEADPQRLKVVIEIEAPTGTSTLRVYTPMFQAKGELAKASAVKPALPEHLGDVQVGIAARLAQIDVPLAQLLEIEIGDVIPLRVAVGTQLDVLVEDQRCMSAGIGQCQGKLAVRIAGIERPKSES